MAYIYDEQGRYKRTITCSHCHNTGHNRNFCTIRMRDLEIAIKGHKDHLKRDNNDLARTKLWRATGDLEKMKSAGKNRKCSYCRKPEHTRRTCTARKDDIRDMTHKTILMRQKVADRMMRFGFIPGALISISMTNRSSDTGHITVGDQYAMALITKIRLEKVWPSQTPQKGVRWYSPSIVEYEFIAPQHNAWTGKEQNHGTTCIPVHYMNIDDVNIDEQYHDTALRHVKLISKAQCNGVLTEDMINYDKVSIDVEKNIIDS